MQGAHGSVNLWCTCVYVLVVRGRRMKGYVASDSCTSRLAWKIGSFEGASLFASAEEQSVLLCL